jgi:hypothetical protein
MPWCSFGLASFAVARFLASGVAFSFGVLGIALGFDSGGSKVDQRFSLHCLPGSNWYGRA